MRFNQHSDIKGRHAFLSPSSYHWLNYDDIKLESRYFAARAAKRGTDLHDLAHKSILLGIRLDPTHEALASYVNDAIDYGMKSEQSLFYSDNCFGTADAISFKNLFLRIHDLKNGITPTSFKQLEVYAGLFCLEYGVDPYEIETELRIYQRDEVRILDGSPDVISHIMDKIVSFDKQIESIKEELDGNYQ